MKRMATPTRRRKGKKMTGLINNKESFTIETCGVCGTQFYNVMGRCANCGNMILTSEKYDELTWRNKKASIVKARAKETLKQNKAAEAQHR